MQWPQLNKLQKVFLNKSLNLIKLIGPCRWWWPVGLFFIACQQSPVREHCMLDDIIRLHDSFIVGFTLIRGVWHHSIVIGPICSGYVENDCYSLNSLDGAQSNTFLEELLIVHEKISGILLN